MRIARGCCDAFVAQQRLDVLQVGSALQEESRRRMPQRVSGNDWHRARSQASLMRALNAWLLKGAPSRPGKTRADPAKYIPQSAPACL